MPDADDFDVEELRRLIRGESARQPEAAPAATPAPRAGATGPKKGVRPAAGAKAKPRAGRRKR